MPRSIGRTMDGADCWMYNNNMANFQCVLGLSTHSICSVHISGKVIDVDEMRMRVEKID